MGLEINRNLRRVLYPYKAYILDFFWNIFFYPFYHEYVKYKSKKIRQKDKIKVLFIIAELSAWKTENLYNAMLNHPRFDPYLGVTTSMEVPNSKSVLIDYLVSKGYCFVDLDSSLYSINKIDPDIKFYYKPYDASYPKQHIFKKHLTSLNCYINYGLSMMGNQEYVKRQYSDYSWLSFADNSIVAQNRIEINRNRADNVRVTGVPMQDRLIESQMAKLNPWKPLNKLKIIYAPHHSILGTNGKRGIEYSTFLDYGEYILSLVEKCQDSIQWAFKPHPTLYKKLLNVWGPERTNKYYERWGQLCNSQICMGDYDSLFAFSDAMIHDCSSFTIEYHYTQKPVLFLLNGKDIPTEDLNDFGRLAYELHYKAYCKDQIDQFIDNILKGFDPKSCDRQDFYKKFLIPPNNSSACENIIDAILGNCQYQ